MGKVHLISLMALIAASRQAMGQGGWDGSDKYAMIGLVTNTSGTNLQIRIGSITKYRGNPLFQQDKLWEPRLDNGYPNVVYDPTSAGDGPWRLWYGGIAPGGQYLYYANSSDGLTWDKPDLNRYDLSHWREPWAKSVGKRNNIVMAGGGLGMYHDLHDPDSSQRYKLAGGSPAGCYSDDGASNCVVGTAGSPNGIDQWSHVAPLRFPAPWRPDCHTNLFYDFRTNEYRMTTRDYTRTSGRDISISVSGGGSEGHKRWTGNWTLQNRGEYPPTTQADGQGCTRLTSSTGQSAVDVCGKHCRDTDDCAFFWVYTAGKDSGTCCPKSAVLPGKLQRPVCTTCGGEFYKMDGTPVSPPPPPVGNRSKFGDWKDPVIIESGTEAYQLYSQITWPFYDIYFGIVMVFDAETGSVGPNAGHVHCRLAWSADGLTNWAWVDSEHAHDHDSSSIPDFIPAGLMGTFESHVCFAAHTPLRMPDGSVRIYYMGGNGPHSGARNSSFALATLRPDGFASIGGEQGTVQTRLVYVSGTILIMSADVKNGGSITVGIVGTSTKSQPITSNITDGTVTFPNDGLRPFLGKQVSLNIIITGGADVYTIGFTSHQ